MTRRQLSSDGYWESGSSTDQPPPVPGLAPLEGLWPCTKDSHAVGPRQEKGLQPDPEALRRLEEAWRHAVP